MNLDLGELPPGLTEQTLTLRRLRLVGICPTRSVTQEQRWWEDKSGVQTSASAEALTGHEARFKKR